MKEVGQGGMPEIGLWGGREVDSSDVLVLENTIVIAHIHLSPSNLGLLRKLARIVDHGNLFLLEKPYSSTRAVYDELLATGATVVPVLHVAGGPYEIGLRHGLNVLWERVVSQSRQRGINRIVIMDDGDGVTQSVPQERLEDIHIAAVEPTQRGIDELHDMLASRLSVVSVAQPRIQGTLDPKWIAHAAITRLTESGVVSASNRRPIGVAGLGVIGSALLFELRKLGLQVLQCDLNNDTLSLGANRIVSVDMLMQQCNVVVSCAGRDIFEGISLAQISGSKTLVSTSSADVEFRSLLIAAGKLDHGFEDVHIRVHDRLDVTILNGGFPVNFNHDPRPRNIGIAELTGAPLI